MHRSHDNQRNDDLLRRSKKGWPYMYHPNCDHICIIPIVGKGGRRCCYSKQRNEALNLPNCRKEASNVIPSQLIPNSPRDTAAEWNDCGKRNIEIDDVPIIKYRLTYLRMYNNMCFHYKLSLTSIARRKNKKTQGNQTRKSSYWLDRVAIHSFDLVCCPFSAPFS